MKTLTLSQADAELLLDALNSHEGVISTDYLQAVRNDSESLRRLLATRLAHIRQLADRINRGE